MEGVPTKLLGVATLSKDVSEQRTLTGSVGFFSILGQRLSSKFRANRLYKNLILKRHRAIQFVSVKAYLKGNASLPVDVRRSKLKNAFALSLILHYRKNLVRTH